MTVTSETPGLGPGEGRERGPLFDVVFKLVPVLTVEKSLFEQRVGSLSRRKMSDVDRGLQLALGLRT